MKNIFQNNSIKKAAAAGMIAAQVSMGTNFLSDSFVDTSFAEGGFYNSYNSSIFEELSVNKVNPIETVLEKTRCVLDSDNNLNIKPRAYSIDNIGGLQNFKLFNNMANTIQYSSSPSLDGLYVGSATNTFSFGPNYNGDITISATLSDPTHGVITQISPDSFDYTSIPSPTFDYATATYSASTGLGDTLTGVIIYNNFVSARSATALNIDYNQISSVIRFGSNPAIEVGQNPINGTLTNISNEYKYQPNLNYIGQDFFTLFGIDYFVSVLRPSSTNGFEGGNMNLSPGISAYYGSSNLNNIGTSRFYKSRISNIPFTGNYLYKLEAPTTTLPLPQLSFNGSSTSFFINTISNFYRDLVKGSVLDFAKQFTIIVEHDNRAPSILPTAATNFTISSSTGVVALTSDYKDLEGDNFDLIYEVSNDGFDTNLSTSSINILTPGINSTSSNVSNFILPVGSYEYRLNAIENNSTQNCIGYSNASGLKIASSTSAIKSFTVSNTITVPTTTPTTTPPVITPSASVTPQGGLLPLIIITPEPTVIVPTTTPSTIEIKLPVKEVLGLNPEDSDDLLPGETPAAYLIRKEKRRVLGRSGSRDLLVETGYNSTLKIFAGVTLLAGVMLLINNRKEKKIKLI